MSIFDLHATVLADYRDFVRSFFIGLTNGRGDSLSTRWSKRRLWPDSLLQVSPALPVPPQ